MLGTSGLDYFLQVSTAHESVAAQHFVVSALPTTATESAFTAVSAVGPDVHATNVTANKPANNNNFFISWVFLN
jgi:hypothetical protein